MAICHGEIFCLALYTSQKVVKAWAECSRWNTPGKIREAGGLESQKVHSIRVRRRYT